MPDFDLNSIGALLSGSGLSALSRRTKVSKEDVAKVLSQGLPVLVAGMRRNADSKEGETALSRAIADHSRDDCSDPAAFVKGADLTDGKKILGHVLGEEQMSVVTRIAELTGVTKAKTTTILALVAPLLLSLLGSSGSGSSGGLLETLGGLLGLGSAGSQSGFLGGLLGGSSNQGGASDGAGLLGGLLGGASTQSGQSSALTGGLLSALLGSGSFGESPQNSQNGPNTIQLAQQTEQQEQSSSGGLLDSFLSLFH